MGSKPKIHMETIKYAFLIIILLSILKASVTGYWDYTAGTFE